MHRILITGGASGLGQGLALAWAEKHAAKAQICIADINAERGEETLSLLRDKGAEAIYQHCDITVQEDVTAAVEAVKRAFGGIDVVVNNAGVATGGSLEGESLAQWQWVMDVNVLGMVRVSQAFMPLFRQQGHGRFINIASQAGITPVPCMGSYNAAKAAVVGFSETMHLELGPQNVKVHVVCPSFFKTNLDESMRTTEPTAKAMMDKMFEKASMTTSEVAQYIFDAVEKDQFMIITHPEGRLAYRMKKFLSRKGYLAQMSQRTHGLVKRMIAEREKTQ